MAPCLAERFFGWRWVQSSFCRMPIPQQRHQRARHAAAKPRSNVMLAYGVTPVKEHAGHLTRPARVSRYRWPVRWIIGPYAAVTGRPMAMTVSVRSRKFRESRRANAGSEGDKITCSMQRKMCERVFQRSNSLFHWNCAHSFPCPYTEPEENDYDRSG